MSDLAVIHLSGWEVAIPPEANSEIQAHIDALNAVDVESIPTNAFGQRVADSMADVLSKTKAFADFVDKSSAELRKPYFDMAKRIKAATDNYILPLLEAQMRVGQKLAEYEAEKKRIEQELERQRQAEIERKRREEEERQRQAELERQRQERAERERLAEIERQKQAEANAARRAELERQAEIERQRQAEAEAARAAQRQNEQQQLAEISTNVVRFETPKTEGVQTRTAWEFEVTDKAAFAQFCWRSGRPHWVRTLEFAKREIMEYLNSDGVDRSLPGCRVYEAIGVNVRKAKMPKTLTVASTKVAL